MKLEFRKYGNGSSVYEVFLMTDYNPLTKRERFDSLGFVEKVNGQWVSDKLKSITGKTRKEVAEKLVGLYRDGALS